MCKPRKEKNLTQPPYVTPGPVAHVPGHFIGVWEVKPLPPDVTQGYAEKCEKKKKTDEPDWNFPPSPPPAPKLNSELDSAPPKNSSPSPPPLLNSDSDGAKAKQSKKPSDSDQKHARPDTTIVTSPSPRSGSGSDDPATRKTSALKQPPPPSPEKHKTGAMEQFQNNHHKSSTPHEFEGNTRKTDEFTQPHVPPPSTAKQKLSLIESLADNKHDYGVLNETQQMQNGYWTSVTEEQTTKPRKTSSNDNKNFTGTKWPSEEEEISSNYAIFPKPHKDNRYG